MNNPLQVSVELKSINDLGAAHQVANDQYRETMRDIQDEDIYGEVVVVLSHLKFLENYRDKIITAVFEVSHT